MKLWLDDIRDPEMFGYMGWTWVTTAEDAIKALQTGTVEQASLDHDLTLEQTMAGMFYGIYADGCKSGYDVVCWLEQNPQYLPPKGVAVHSANPCGKERMEKVLAKLYAEKRKKV